MKMHIPKSGQVLFALLFILGLSLHGQVTIRDRSDASAEEAFGNPPRLVVGIVVDQMRYDYLSRFWAHYGPDGFKRLVGEGFLARNHHFNYLPTKTAPGHASIYTGTTPAIHGILGNEWYDKDSRQEIYCVDDDSVTPVGTAMEIGKKSPHRLLVTTLTDQLELHTQRQSKVISISLKDRGSVLPAGHLADAAYWFENETGHWISSSFYMDQLPKWVDAFNQSGAKDRYRGKWEPLKPLSEYVESGPDYSEYEDTFRGEAAPVFPHDLEALWEQNEAYKMIRYSPFGNSLTVDFVLEALKEEDLGADAITDFLCVSFSSTDHIGHDYGVNSKEVQDTYIRLDRDLGRLLKGLDRRLGKGTYTVFLTADHGAGDAMGYLKALKAPAGYFKFADIRGELEAYISYKYGVEGLIEYEINNQVYLNQELIANLEIDPEGIRKDLAERLMVFPGVEAAYTVSEMRSGFFPDAAGLMHRKGFNPKRSGDILYVVESGRSDYLTGSSHFTQYAYDTHVPLIFFGAGIRPGTVYHRTEVTDIAPTVAALLGIAFPSGTTGQPISEVLD